MTESSLLIDKPRAEQVAVLMDHHNLTREMSEFVLNAVDGKVFGREVGGTRQQAYAAAFPNSKSPKCQSSNANRALNSPKVKPVYRSLLAEHDEKADEERSSRFMLTKEKVVEDLELLKVKALREIDADRGSGGAFQGFVKAAELQGREIGMFAQNHLHKHEHSVVPNERLLERLSQSNPVLANELGRHLGVIEGEAVEVE